MAPKFHLAVGPGARWTGAEGRLAYFSYETNYLIDLNYAIIVDVEPTTAIRQAEMTVAKQMIERIRERLDLYPARLAADRGYGSADMLGRLTYEQGIEPHVSATDKSGRRDGTFQRSDFTFDHAGDVYFCPAGKMLATNGVLVNDETTLLYRASTYDCQACKSRMRCCPNAPARKIPRSKFEGVRDMAREIMASQDDRASKRRRKKFEMRFGL